MCSQVAVLWKVLINKVKDKNNWKTINLNLEFFLFEHKDYDGKKKQLLTCEHFENLHSWNITKQNKATSITYKNLCSWKVEKYEKQVTITKWKLNHNIIVVIGI